MTASWTGLAGESRGTPMADLGIAVYDHLLPGALGDRLFKSMSPDSFGEREQVRRFIESVRCLTEDYMLNEGDYGPGGRSEGQGFKADYAPEGILPELGREAQMDAIGMVRPVSSLEIHPDQTGR